jgi:hypothetical protein
MARHAVATTPEMKNSIPGPTGFGFRADEVPPSAVASQLIALPARQRGAEPSRASFGRQDPGTHLPRRRVANMLRVSAFELGDPVLFQVLAKADDASLGHGDVPLSRTARYSANRFQPPAPSVASR